MSEVRKQKKSSFISFAVFLFLMFLVINNVFIPLYPMINNSYLFFGIIISLVFFSFISSACEAALSATKDQKEFSDIYDQKIDNIVRIHLLPFDEKGIRNLTAKEEKQLQKHKKKIRQLEKMKEMFDTNMVGYYIGALATLSVFLNLLVAITLPVAITNCIGLLHIQYPLIMSNHDPLIQVSTLTIERGEYDITSVGLLVFISSTIPVLLLGKIIPKDIGVRKSKFFLTQFRHLIWVTGNFLGWISKGTLWPVRLVVK